MRKIRLVNIFITVFFISVFISSLIFKPNWFDLQYLIVFTITYALLFNKDIRDAYYNKNEEIKLPEILLVVVFVGVVSLVFNFHTNVADKYDNPEDKSEPLKWLKPSKIINYPIEQLVSINGGLKKKVLTSPDSTKKILNLIVFDATKYKRDKPKYITFNTKLKDFLSKEIKYIDEDPKPVNDSFFKEYLVKYLLAKSVEFDIKHDFVTNKQYYTSILIYQGNENCQVLPKSDYFFKTSNELKSFIKNNCVNEINKHKPIPDASTKFELLFQRLGAGLLKNIDIEKFSKIKISIISDFVQEAESYSKKFESEQLIRNSMKGLFDNPKIERLNLYSCTSLSNDSLGPNQFFATDLIIDQAERDLNDVFFVDLHNNLLDGVLGQLESSWYNITSSKNEEIEFSSPHITNEHDKIVLARLEFAGNIDKYSLYYGENSIYKRDAGVLTLNDVIDISYGSSNEEGIAKDMAAKLAITNADMVPNEKSRILLSFPASQSLKKFNIVINENNSISNPTLLLFFYSIGNTCLYLIILSPLIKLFNCKCKKVKNKQNVYIRNLLILLSFTLPFLFFLYLAESWKSLFLFQNFLLPIFVSLSLIVLIIYKTLHHCTDDNEKK